MDKKKEITSLIELPEGIESTLDKGTITIKGKLGEVKNKFLDPKVKITKEDKNIRVSGIKSTKREKKVVNAYAAIIKNMIKGASEGHKYVLKICSGHFPMTVSINKNQLIVKNFFGEKTPRTLLLKEEAKVKVEGDLITIEGNDKDLCGQTASDIEHLTKRPNFDPRIFQDGIYMINKDGKDIK